MLHIFELEIHTDVYRICLVFLFTKNVEITFRITSGISYIHNIISVSSFELFINIYSVSRKKKLYF